MDQKSTRIASLDALRGLIMILMALDHASFFIAQQHSPGEYWGGSFPTCPEALPFLTRAATHLAAPGFFLLMGGGMALLSLFYRIGRRWAPALAPLTVLGRTPLFFYILHLFLYAGLANWLVPGGTSIPGMLPYWLLGLLCMAPLCYLYGKLKERQPADSLLRFF